MEEQIPHGLILTQTLKVDIIKLGVEKCLAEARENRRKRGM
jgi:hypothetical protein